MQTIGKPEVLVARIINRAACIIFLCSFTAYTFYAQEQGKKEMGDSLVIRPPINQYLLRSFQKDVVLPPSLQTMPEYSSVYLSQSLTIPLSSLTWQNRQQVEINSYWKQELAKQDEYKTLRLILGSIQAGGTAYLLYEHIKKYGLK